MLGDRERATAAFHALAELEPEEWLAALPQLAAGDHWIEESVIEIFKEDIARFRTLLSTEMDGDPFDALADGRAPSLKALRLHNSTVYRWNRVCYGISDNGRPHLRIENRILPSGPPISQTSGHFDFRSHQAIPESNADPLDYWYRTRTVSLADGVPEMLKRVRENLRMGAAQIKLATGGGVSSAGGAGARAGSSGRRGCSTRRCCCTCCGWPCATAACRC